MESRLSQPSKRAAMDTRTSSLIASCSSDKPCAWNCMEGHKSEDAPRWPARGDPCCATLEQRTRLSFARSLNQRAFTPTENILESKKSPLTSANYPLVYVSTSTCSCTTSGNQPSNSHKERIDSRDLFASHACRTQAHFARTSLEPMKTIRDSETIKVKFAFFWGGGGQLGAERKMVPKHRTWVIHMAARRPAHNMQIHMDFLCGFVSKYTKSMWIGVWWAGLRVAMWTPMWGANFSMAC